MDEFSLLLRTFSSVLSVIIFMYLVIVERKLTFLLLEIQCVMLLFARYLVLIGYFGGEKADPIVTAAAVMIMLVAIAFLYESIVTRRKLLKTRDKLIEELNSREETP